VTVTWVADHSDQHRERHVRTFAGSTLRNGSRSTSLRRPSCGCSAVRSIASKRVSYERLVQLDIGPPKIGTIKLASLATPSLSTPMINEWRDQLVARHSRRLARLMLQTLKAILNKAVARNAALPVKIDTRKRDEEKLGIGRGSRVSRRSRRS
jgi:hypothetical protein